MLINDSIDLVIYHKSNDKILIKIIVLDWLGININTNLI